MSPFWTRLICRVLTPTGPVLQAEAVSVSVPAVDGRLGILGGHAPMVVQLGTGVLSVRCADGRHLGYYTQGGHAQVAEEHVTVLLEQCVALDALDAEAVWEELQSARAQPAQTPPENARRREAIYSAQRKFRAIQLWRRRHGEAHRH